MATVAQVEYTELKLVLVVTMQYWPEIVVMYLLPLLHNFRIKLVVS